MGGGHGIGIKRNDYHRRNRKRNISMHSHSHGFQRNMPEVRIIKRADVTPFTEYLERFNREQEERMLAAYEAERVDEDDVFDWSGALSSLERQCLIYTKPMLPADEIRRRRFESGVNNNDRWWEWEAEIRAKKRRGEK